MTLKIDCPSKTLWLFLMLLWFFVAPRHLDALDKVSIVHSVQLSATIAPLLYGIQRGFFRDENIDLEYRVLRTDIGVKALVTNEIDYLYSAGTAIRASIRGLPIRALSYDMERLPHYLMARPAVKSARDLHGKIVGVSSPGASGDITARACLRSMGIDTKKDVIIVAMGSDAIRYSALKAGSVDAIIAPLPRNILLRKEGFTELCYAGRIFKGAVSGVIASMERIRSKPAQAKAVLRGMLKTSRAISRDKNDFIEFLVNRVKLDRDVATETATVLIEVQTKNGMIEENDLQGVIEAERQIVGVDRPVKISDVADYSLIREVLREDTARPSP